MKKEVRTVDLWECPPQLPKDHAYLLLTEPVSLGHKLFLNAVGRETPSCLVEKLPGGHLDMKFLEEL